MSGNDQSSAMQNIDVEKEIISDNREKERIGLSNELIAQLISEQVKQNELIRELANQNNLLRTKLDEVNKNTESNGVPNEINHNKRLSDEKLKEKFAAEVKDYYGGKTNDPKTDFKAWKDSVDTFRQIYSESIPDDNFMIQLIKLRIKGAAKGWYESEEHTFKSLKEAINNIEERFGSNNPFWEFIDKCRDYNPEGKSMKKIGEDFQELVDVAPEFISEQFLAGEFYRRIPVGLTGYILNNRPPETTTWTQLLGMTYNYENTF